MWTRLSDNEYAAALATSKRESLARRLLAPPVIWVAMTLFFKFFGLGSQYDAVQRELDWTESAIVSGVLTLIASVGLIWFGRSSGDSGERFCPDCQTVSEAQPGDLLLCACGGTLEPLDQWRWHDEPHPEALGSRPPGR